jgi:lipoprotein NlpD
MIQEHKSIWAGRVVLGAIVAMAATLSACTSTSLNRAPVEDRGAPTASTTTQAPAAPVAATAPTATGSVNGAASVTATAPKPLPGAENAGKPGYYTVKPGDTMIRIGLDSGQNWRDVARWNGLDNPNIIEVGQVLRVIPPGTADVATGATGPRPVTPPSAVVATTLPSTSTRPAAPTVPASAPASVPAPAAPAPVVAVPPLPPASSAGDDDVAWIWPTNGAVIAGFDEAKNKGLDIAGKLGDPVLAAGDGRVVYAGAGLRGYGNLVILKHNNTYLTAYAHNQTLLVKEDQTVRKGQKIAEMGQSDSDRVKLHFEIRRQGKPVDPARYLSPR